MEIEEYLPLYLGADVVYRMDAPHAREIKTQNKIEFLAYINNCMHPGVFDDPAHRPNLKYVKLLLRDIRSINPKELSELTELTNDQISDADIKKLCDDIKKHGFNAFSTCEAMEVENAFKFFKWLLKKQFDIFNLIKYGKAFDKYQYEQYGKKPKRNGENSPK